MSDIFRPEVFKTIEEAIDKYKDDLIDLSIKIHDHPEVKFEERYAHDVLTSFMEAHGFEVTRHYLNMDTAWRAMFRHGAGGGRVLGLNSEMDALPGIGHACGHNLIAIIGVGISLAVKAAMVKHDVEGSIVLLGTPAEEGGGGKVILIERGGYEGMDVCLMAHPGGGGSNSKTVSTGSSIALQRLVAEYKGHPAHAGASPWEGRNSLDAAFIAYGSISALRQQIHPSNRVHGIVEGRDWAPNVIPDYAKMTWMVRAPTVNGVEELRERVVKCLEAGALATNTKFEIEYFHVENDLLQNKVLGQEFSDIASKRYGMEVLSGDIDGSTDFGNVTYVLPALHSFYAIPSLPNGGNHTAEFTASARTQEAHEITLNITKVLALTGFRVLDDEEFFKEVRAAFEESMKTRKIS